MKMKEALQKLGGSFENSQPAVESPSQSTILKSPEVFQNADIPIDGPGRRGGERYQKNIEEMSLGSGRKSEQEKIEGYRPGQTAHFEKENSESIPEIRIDESSASNLNSFQRANPKPSFYKKKIENLRETLRSIKHEIKEEPKMPMLLDSKLNSSKNRVPYNEPESSPKIRINQNETIEDPNIKFFKQEIQRLQYFFI